MKIAKLLFYVFVVLMLLVLPFAAYCMISGNINWLFYYIAVMMLIFGVMVVIIESKGGIK